MSEEDLIKRLHRLGVQVEVLSLDTTITGHGMYVRKATFAEALAAFIEKALRERKELQQWKEAWMPIVTDWSSKH